MDNPKTKYNNLQRLDPTLPSVKIIYSESIEDFVIKFYAEGHLVYQGDEICFLSRAYRNKMTAEKEIYQKLLVYFNK